jgi:hypothetical protein
MLVGTEWGALKKNQNSKRQNSKGKCKIQNAKMQNQNSKFKRQNANAKCIVPYRTRTVYSVQE